MDVRQTQQALIVNTKIRFLISISLRFKRRDPVVSLQIPFGKRFKRRDPVSILVFSAPLLGLPYASLVFGSSFFLILAVDFKRLWRNRMGSRVSNSSHNHVPKPSRRLMPGSIFKHASHRIIVRGHLLGLF